MSRSLFFGLIILITVMALALRLPGLAKRPMHGDEAVNAVKIGELIEGKGYRYDPHEYHGPTLNYFSLIPAWLGGADSFVELSEAVLRIVPVTLGLALVVLVLPLREALGQGAVLLSAGLTALSPAMVFYSRYFIHELILVVFTVVLIISGYRCFKSRKAGWAVLAGVSLGLMHATKETFVIAVGAIGLGVIVLLGARLKNGQRLESTTQ
ncbi:MAG: glycosyltransferase family 39 protein, partial [Limisphaerales bacterium]